jgi:hypothetical protein
MRVCSVGSPPNARFGLPWLAADRTRLFTGATLNGLLLNAWGWAVIGIIATLAGIILIILGAILLLPLANWQINLKRRPAGATAV